MYIYITYTIHLLAYICLSVGLFIVLFVLNRLTFDSSQNFMMAIQEIFRIYIFLKTSALKNIDSVFYKIYII